VPHENQDDPTRALMLAMPSSLPPCTRRPKIDLNGTWVFAVETDQGSGT